MENLICLDKIKQKICFGLIMALTFTAITVFIGSKNVHADTWSVTLPICKAPANGRTYTASTCNARMSLTRIVGGPSYYVRSQMINSDGDPRTDDLVVKQADGYKDFSNNTMSYTYKYKLLVCNDYWEWTTRSAYGYIDVGSN